MGLLPRRCTFGGPDVHLRLAGLCCSPRLSMIPRPGRKSFRPRRIRRASVSACTESSGTWCPGRRPTTNTSWVKRVTKSRIQSLVDSARLHRNTTSQKRCWNTLPKTRRRFATRSAAPGPTAVRRGRSGLRIPAPGHMPADGPSTGANAGNWPCGAYRSTPSRLGRSIPTYGRPGAEAPRRRRR